MMVDRDDLLRRTHLAALLNELSPQPPARIGPHARWRCIDPGHDDRHPSITMFVDRAGIPRWRCWSGGHGGTAIDAILVARGGTIADAIHELHHRARTTPEITNPPPHAPHNQQPRLAPGTPPDPALAEYVTACERILWTPAGRQVRDYLLDERRLTPDVLKINRIGADPARHVLRRSAGLPHGGPAAVLPTLDQHGNLTYAQARYLDPPPGRSKYDNPAAHIAPNPRIGWVTPAVPTRTGTLWVCEGTIDALTAATHGQPAVAVLGATYADERVARAIGTAAAGRQIVLAFDNDDAGRTATDNLLRSLPATGCNPHVLILPDGADLNSTIHRYDLRAAETAVQPPIQATHGLRRALSRSQVR